jgi:uncharacterized OsmC-like protein
MNPVEITYEGHERYRALNVKNGRSVAVDCPMTRGEEFGPDGLVAAGLGACMLISMNAFAERHGLDLSGAHADVDVSLAGRPQPRISAIDVTIRLPRSYDDADRVALEKAAGSCPIKHSFRDDTEISTRFEYGDDPGGHA